MLCETTYGDRDHPPRQKEEDNFIKKINETLENEGSVIIPVFALGRSQEILLILAQNKFKVPVYFDGMGIAATDIILSNAEDLKDKKSLEQALKKVKKIKSEKDRMDAVKKQCIIVTTSGMLTGGPVMYYLRYMHNDPRHAILMTGYQAKGTNGRLLLEKSQVYIDGWKKPVKCKIAQFDFSAHSGMSELKELVRHIKPKKVVFVHGEPESVMNMQEWASAMGMDAYAPRLGDIIQV
jgi:putative mRNA 3-end processing factor